MKKIICMLLVISLLSGCSIWGGREYIAVTPHDEGYQVAVDSDAITVSSYLGLKNAILGFVEEGIEAGVIRAESYPGQITDDLDDAVYEVWRGDPLGAYAVDYMTYDCSKIVNQYEIHVHTTYRRSVEEISSIDYASDEDAVRLRLTDAMEAYQDKLTLRIGEYRPFDIQEMVSEIYLEHPEFALELPAVSAVAYPESGSQRILEIQFEYETSTEQLLQKNAEMTESLDLISSLYGSNNDEVFCAKRFYDRVRRDGILLSPQDDTGLYSESVYGVLCENEATSLGYAQTYLLLLASKDITAHLIKGKYMGQTHYICSILLDNEIFYADPSPTVMIHDYENFMLTEEDLLAYGYEIT